MRRRAHFVLRFPNTREVQMEKVLSRVLRGAALLDERSPHWFETVNLTTFTMRLIGKCVLSYAYGDFFVGLEALGMTMAKSVAYGFSTNRMSEYNAITTLWRDEILARRMLKRARFRS